MIAALLPSGPGFPALANYLTEDGRELLAWTSEPVLSLASVGMEMEALASMNVRLNDEPERALLHNTLSWPPDERPDAQTILAVARASVSALGFSEKRHQVLIVIHDDTPTHIHAHIAINRVRTGDYRMHNPRLPMVTLDRFCREMELEHRWTHAPGLHTVEYRNEGPVIVRRRTRSADKQRPTPAARNGQLFTGLPSFQEWVGSAPRLELRDLLADRDATQPELHTALAAYNLELVHHKRGLAVVDRDDRKLRVAASALDVGLDIGTFTMRFGELRPMDTAPLPERRYRDDARNFAPDTLRDKYERERSAWLSSPSGNEATRRRHEIREWLKRERARLRRERDKALRSARHADDPKAAEALAFVVYHVRRAELEQDLILRRSDLRDLERALGKPAATFFKWKRAQQDGQGGASPPLDNEIVGAQRYAAMPPEIPGFTHALGPSGRDYYRDRLRVMVLKGDRVTVLSKDAQDVAAATRLAREVYGSDIQATGDDRFVGLMRRLGVDVGAAPIRSIVRRA